MLAITNATIITPATTVPNGSVILQGGLITKVGPSSEVQIPTGIELLDARGKFLVPGFIDLQISGAFGYDFTTYPERIRDAAPGLLRYGVTSFLPSIVSTTLQGVSQAQSVLVQGSPGKSPGARPLGLHVEGPFINPDKKGAHDAKYLLPPATRDVAGWSPETGITLVTLAPELAGASEVVRTLVEQGVVVSAGHSCANYEVARSSVEIGVRYATHLFNGMQVLHHREPGLVGAMLADERVITGLIADGIHVHPAVVKVIWQLLGDGRLNLVTDAMAALGKEPGTYRLGR
jgi:N-acetylglucosamine-6-phosphate deacetylase